MKSRNSQPNGMAETNAQQFGGSRLSFPFSHPVILAMETIPWESGLNKLPYVTSYMAIITGPE